MRFNAPQKSFPRRGEVAQRQLGKEAARKRCLAL
jgi:hypothetical protein